LKRSQKADFDAGYLQDCQKKGLQKSRVIVDAIKEYIKSTTRWMEEEHKDVHLKQIREIWDANDYDPQGGIEPIVRRIEYLYDNVCRFNNAPCDICRKIFQDLEELKKDEDQEAQYTLALVGADGGRVEEGGGGNSGVNHQK
jgi:hypothetical protein